jgi:hypothetical protein
MDARGVAEAMRQALKAHYVGLDQIIEFTGWGKTYVRSLMEGVDYVGDKRNKKFFVVDVAKRLAEKRGVFGKGT